MDPEDDRDPYLWIIWYILKAGNDKLFKGIDRDPLELVRYGKSDYLAWYNANDTIHTPLHAQIVEETQDLSLGNICMVDGSWTSTDQFSGIGWVWKDGMRKIQLMGTQNYIRRECALHSELEALRWTMENMLQHSTCQNFGTDYKDLIAMINVPHAWLSFATELESIETLQICFPDFKISHIP